MNRWLRSAPIGLGLLLAAAPGLAADEPLYYFVENGQVVITNTPSRRDVRRLPTKPSRCATTVRLPATPFDPYIERVAAETGLSPGLIKAVALVESGFDPRAVSPKGAQGLMQLMPGTSRQYGVTDPFDPLQNLRAGARHMRNMLDRFDGNLTLALAAYNAGASTVRRHGGVPNYRETRDYVRKVRERLGGQPAATRTRASTTRSAPPIRLVRRADGSVLIRN